MDPRYGGQPGVAQPWPPAPHQPSPGRRRLSWTALIALVVAIAALVLGVIGLVRSDPNEEPAPSSSTAAPTATTASTDTTAADRALCTAIGPLMAENNKFTNAWADLGEPGTPAKDAAIPKFISDTQDWVSRVQPILDRNPDASAYFLRSLQRFIDDQHLFVVDLAPGPLPAYGTSLWVDTMAAYAGPLHVCYGLGIRW
jgi:hypothetical protein